MSKILYYLSDFKVGDVVQSFPKKIKTSDMENYGEVIEVIEIHCDYVVTKLLKDTPNNYFNSYITSDENGYYSINEEELSDSEYKVINGWGTPLYKVINE